MIHDFVKMIDNIDFLYGFMYLYDYDNYDHLAMKLCSELIIPIINITKKEHIKEYNEHIKDIIDNLESTKDMHSICSHLMNICCEGYFKLSQDKYLKIKKFIDNNIDIIESTLAPMNDYLVHVKNAIITIIARVIIIIKKVICIFPQNRYKEFHEKITKSYFNIWYIKFFYLLQKIITLNKKIYNISILVNIFMNLYDNCSIDCNKKNKNKIYDLYNNIVLNKFVHSNKNKKRNVFTIYK